jgi:hypothetical protein
VTPRIGRFCDHRSTIKRARLASSYAWAGDKDRAPRDLTPLLQKSGCHFVRFDGGDDCRARISVHELRTCLEFFPLQGDPKNNEPLFWPEAEARPAAGNGGFRRIGRSAVL